MRLRTAIHFHFIQLETVQKCLESPGRENGELLLLYRIYLSHFIIYIKKKKSSRYFKELKDSHAHFIQTHFQMQSTFKSSKKNKQKR